MKAHTIVYSHYSVTGTTLIELMVVIAITAILLSIALFNFHDWQLSNRRTNYMQTLHRQLLAARAYAVYHNQYVRVCPHSAQQCTNSWQQDIMVFVDENNDGQRNNTEQVLHVLPAPSDGDNINYPRSGFSFKTTGSLSGFNNGSFVYCSVAAKLNQPAIRLTVSPSGRVRWREDSDNCD
ncbi:GspH/FimT family pseudopilin [Pseudoalteromonas sp. T1lg75]|uniref:GspH/FimT family pseudopilin n=1 Tax=Pseudoalteromonas sp. T1lg75 TaxID=2077102 RepID=UPI000CF653A6|nr:GspH/FimT family pseudopilin [Pseudoalteromonas sp. T1lg75]